MQSADDHDLFYIYVYQIRTQIFMIIMIYHDFFGICGHHEYHDNQRSPF